MYKLTIEDENGGVLQFGMDSPYTISEIEGLSPPEADIHLNELALLDGQKYNGAKTQIRTMNIAFAIEYDAERNRLEAYKVLRVKKRVKVSYKSDLRDVFIEGYISSVHVTHFEMKQIVTVTIICPSPYFRAAQEVINELSVIVSAFHFPFASTENPQLIFGIIQNQRNITVTNGGEIDTGLVITLYAKGEISNPKIFNYVTGEFIGLNFDMQVGDEITINTMPGEKTATLLRNGETSNIFNSVMEGSTWLQLQGYETVFVYEVNGELSNLDITFSHYDLFEGV